MKKVILHIGGPKAASSSIQKYLGQNFCGPHGVTNQDNEVLKYFRIGGEDRIINGKKLHRAHLNSPSGYVASIPFRKMQSDFASLLAEIDSQLKDDEVPILSSEGWASGGAAFDLKSQLEQSDVSVDIFFVVRAPIDWINSAWWQWGTWGNTSLEAWIPGMIKATNFYAQYLFWSSIDNVKNIKIVDVSQDPIHQFQKFLKVDFTKVASANVGTHPALLEHLIANKEHYGRTIHHPIIEFRLNKLLCLPRRSLPFIINDSWQQFIIDKTLANSQKLIAEIERSTPGLEQSVKTKYVSTEAYDAIQVRDITSITTAEERDEFAFKLMNIVLE